MLTPWLRTGSSATVLVGALLFAQTIHGGDLPAAKQALFLARAVAYDTNLKSRVGSSVDIAVIAQRGDKASEAMAEAIFKAFTTLESARLLGLPVRVSQVVYAGKEALSRRVRAEGIDTFYLCSGLDGSLADIKEVARAQKVMSLASSPAQLRMGVSLGVFEIEGKNTILVNLEANREEGVAFAPDLLRLATVVK
jgi:hypothetical protein